MAIPTDPAIRRALAFDPAFHDADALIECVSANVVSYQDLNGIAALIQREVRASDALQEYVLTLWRATQAPPSSVFVSTAAAMSWYLPAQVRAA